MATPPVTPNPQEQQIIQQATTGTSAPPPPQEFSVTMADGNEFKGSPEEVAKAIAKRYDNLVPHLRKVEGENAQYRQVIQTLPNQTQTSQNGFDQQKYWDMLVKDPVAAQSYLFQHTPEYQNVSQQLEAQQWQSAAAQFRSANPDFAVNDENIGKLNTLCSKLYPNASVLSAEQMTAAHAMALRNKLYEVQPVTQATPPPPPPAGGVTQENNAPDINKMDQQQLREYIEAETAKQGQK